MAEPQGNTQSDQSRSKENSSQHAGGAAGEARTFDKTAKDAGLVQSPAELARAAGEGGRQIAETSRRAGQQVAEAMRTTLDPFLAMQMDMNRWFDDLWRQAIGFRAPQGMQALRPFGQFGAAGLFGQPATDLQETETAHILAVELPGLNKDDVDIGIDGETLTICGHKAEETENASAAYRVSERRFGRFERSFPLPPDVDLHKIEAQFKDGVLKIVLPKDQTAASRRTKIEIRD